MYFLPLPHVLEWLVLLVFIVLLLLLVFLNFVVLFKFSIYSTISTYSIIKYLYSDDKSLTMSSLNQQIFRLFYVLYYNINTQILQITKLINQLFLQKHKKTLYKNH